MSTQPTERHVRVCPTHMVEVEERGSSLICPRGQHAVSHFKVIDRLKRTSVEVAVDGDDRRGGLVGEGTKYPVRVRPGAVEALSSVGQVAPARAAGPTKPKEVLAKAKFEDSSGVVLWVRLLRRTLKTTGQCFVVQWCRHEPGEKNVAKTAPLAIETYQEKAREAYEAAVAQARKDGWAERAVLRREIKLLPLPKPAAAKKGR